jgi:hypothetical protein
MQLIVNVLNLAASSFFNWFEAPSPIAERTY